MGGENSLWQEPHLVITSTKESLIITFRPPQICDCDFPKQPNTEMKTFQLHRDSNPGHSSQRRGHYSLATTEVTDENSQVMFKKLFIFMIITLVMSQYNRPSN